MYQMVTSNHVGLTLRYTKVHAHAHVHVHTRKRWALPADSHAVHSPTHHVRSVLRPCTHLCWLWAMGASFRDRGVCACHMTKDAPRGRKDAPRRPSGRFRAPALFRCALTPVFRTLRPNRDMFAAPTAVARLGFGMGRARANILVRGSPPTVQAARGIKSQALPV